MNPTIRAAAAGVSSLLAACSQQPQAELVVGPVTQDSAPPPPGGPEAVSGGVGNGSSDQPAERGTTVAPSETPAPSEPTTVVTATTAPPAPMVPITVAPFVLPEDVGPDDEFDWWEGQPGAAKDDAWYRRYTGSLPPDYVWQCESGGDYGADNGAGHTGRWQFSASTWSSVGGSGRAKDASPAEQDYRASRLWDDGAGAGHWSCF